MQGVQQAGELGESVGASDVGELSPQRDVPQNNTVLAREGRTRSDGGQGVVCQARLSVPLHDAPSSLPARHCMSSQGAGKQRITLIRP